MKYFRIVADNERAYPRWHLGEPFDASGEELDAREFTCAKPYTGAAPSTVALKVEGPIFDFNFAAFGMTVLSEKATDFFCSFGTSQAIQAFPVRVQREAGIWKGAIANFLNTVDCIDRNIADFDVWADDHEDVLLRGKIRGFGANGIIIDKAKAAGHHLFRLKDWEIGPVASEDMVDRMQAVSMSGVTFIQLLDGQQNGAA